MEEEFIRRNCIFHLLIFIMETLTNFYHYAIKNWRKVGKTLFLCLFRCVICYLIFLLIGLFISSLFKPHPHSIQVDPVFRLTEKAAEGYLINEQWRDELCKNNKNETLCKLGHEILP